MPSCVGSEGLRESYPPSQGKGWGQQLSWKGAELPLVFEMRLLMATASLTSS